MSRIGKDGHANDRMLGEFWEDESIKVFEKLGYQSELYQRKHGATITVSGQQFICPDIKVWDKKRQVFYAEVKHKYANRSDMFGLETERIRSFLGFQKMKGVKILYLIHDYEGQDKHSKHHVNNQWIGQWLDRLEVHYFKGTTDTYKGGRIIEDVPNHLYPRFLFESISQITTPELLFMPKEDKLIERIKSDFNFYKKNNAILWKIIVDKFDIFSKRDE